LAELEADGLAQGGTGEEFNIAEDGFAEAGSFDGELIDGRAQAGVDEGAVGGGRTFDSNEDLTAAIFEADPGGGDAGTSGIEHLQLNTAVDDLA
jgi:hypothetical protein